MGGGILVVFQCGAIESGFGCLRRCTLRSWVWLHVAVLELPLRAGIAGDIYVSRGVCEARRWVAAHGRPPWANGGWA